MYIRKCPLFPYTTHICTHSTPSTLYQTSVDTVEVLLKKHDEFEGTSSAHDDRIRSLSEQANKLIHAGHYDTTRYSMGKYILM